MSDFLSRGEWVVLGYLANAAWQVPLVFAAAWIAARLARRAGVALEHAVWVLALLLEVGLPAGHLDVRTAWEWATGLLQGQAAAQRSEVRILLEASAARGMGGLRLPANVLAGVAIAFVAVVMYRLVRLGWGLWRTQTIRRRAVPAVLEGEAAEAWLRRSGTPRGGLARSAEIRLSGTIGGPMTVGVLRPAVLLPAGFLDGLAVQDLEAVLAHELAHIQRLDFAKNLAYEAISVAVAWHPAMWMTRARVAESREMVCDETAARAVSGNESYARSLLQLASMVADGRPAKTIHAIGIFDANSFERRVMNLTKRRLPMGVVQRIGIATACAVVAMATCATAMALRVEVGPQMQAVAGGGGETMKVEPGQIKSTNKTPPVYPAEAKAKKDTLDGPVLLAVLIGKDGSVESIHVKQSLRADYDKSALDAVKTWRWEPFLLNGEPTEVETTVTVTYSMGDGDHKSQMLAVPEIDTVGVTDADSLQAGDSMPKLIHQVDAVHPTEARAHNDMLNGSVMMGLTVDKDGSINSLHVDKSLRADYDKSAWAAVEQYRFTPALLNGRPVQKRIEVEVNFSIY